MTEVDGFPDGSRHVGIRPGARRHAIRELRGQLISLVGLVGRPVVDPAGARIGRVNDVVARWSAQDAYPAVTGIVSKVGNALGLLDIDALDVTQTAVRLRTSQLLVEEATRRSPYVALARDVLDHQLVDIGNVQVVRAADVYLVVTAVGIRVAGVDVSFRAFIRRALPRRAGFRPPVRVIDWADLQAFAARPVADATTQGVDDTDRTGSAGVVGGAMRLGVSANQLRTLRPVEIATILHELGRDASSQVVTLAEPVSAAAALSSLRPDARDAVLAQLDEADRDRLVALIAEEPRT